MTTLSYKINEYPLKGRNIIYGDCSTDIIYHHFDAYVQFTTSTRPIMYNPLENKVQRLLTEWTLSSTKVIFLEIDRNCKHS